MNSSITRYRESRSVVHLAFVTRTVESGFVAAGITICIVAGVETMSTLWNWIGL